MAFWGNYFVYDGIPCTEYGLRLYEVNGVAPGNKSFSIPSDISEDRILRRYKSFFYGVSHNKPLTFNMVFGADQSIANRGEYFDAWDLEVISAWLSPIDGYKWLEIEQSDMEHVRFKCRITKLSVVELGNLPIAFSCDVVCDSPFAYRYPISYSYEIDGETEFIIQNLSSYRGEYFPKIKITFENSNFVQIINYSDNENVFEFSELPSENLEVEIDNENGIITNNENLNLYPYFNFNFLKLVRGDNRLKIVGKCVVEIICEFPVSVGG